MSKPRSERSRWVTIYTLAQPWPNAEGGINGKQSHQELRAVVDAFESVGRVVRVEPSKFGSSLVFKARKA